MRWSRASRGNRRTAGAKRGLPTAIVVLAIGLTSLACERTPEKQDGSAIRPDATIQSQIARVAEAKNEAEFGAAVAKLKESGGPNFEPLIPQLVYALMHADDDRAAMTPGVIVQRLGITADQLQKALAPYRNAEDPKQRAQIENLLVPRR